MDIRCEISGGLYSAVGKLPFFPVLLFVGSDKVTGDALAPICGEMLKKMKPPCFLYGDLENPVNAKNLKPTVEFIKRVHRERKILVVDASVGVAEDIGKVKFLDCGIKPGKAVGRDFEPIGDMAIAGIVAAKDLKNQSISPVRLFSVTKMAEEIAREICVCAKSHAGRGKGNGRFI
ncbi:MAG: spore protease YyaC [Bacillota bacterium]